MHACAQVVLLLDNRERFVQRVGTTALTGAQSRPVHMEQVGGVLDGGWVGGELDGGWRAGWWVASWMEGGWVVVWMVGGELDSGW